MYNERLLPGGDLMKNLIVWLGMLLAFGTAQAEWQLDGEHSSISFVSIKNADIAEALNLNRFEKKYREYPGRWYFTGVHGIVDPH